MFKKIATKTSCFVKLRVKGLAEAITPAKIMSLKAKRARSVQRVKRRFKAMKTNREVIRSKEARKKIKTNNQNNNKMNLRNPS